MKIKMLCSIVILGMALSTQISAQCTQTASDCSAELIDYLSDGQYYGATIGEGETAILKITLFGGYTYRLVACTETESLSQIEYSLFDGRKRKVFSNEHLPDGKGWDFKVGGTDLYTIEANLSDGEGCVVFEVGYKEDEDFDVSAELLQDDYDDSDLNAWEQIDEDFSLDDLDEMDLD